MLREDPIDLALVIILICLYSIFTITRAVTSRKIRKATNNVQTKENKFPLLFLQIYIVITVILFFLFIFFPEWFSWAQIKYHRAWQWLGVVLGIIANILFIYSHIYLGRYFSYTLKSFLLSIPSRALSMSFLSKMSSILWTWSCTQ